LGFLSPRRGAFSWGGEAHEGRVLWRGKSLNPKRWGGRGNLGRERGSNLGGGGFLTGRTSLTSVYNQFKVFLSSAPLFGTRRKGLERRGRHQLTNWSKSESV